MNTTCGFCNCEVILEDEHIQAHRWECPRCGSSNTLAAPADVASQPESRPVAPLLPTDEHEPTAKQPPSRKKILFSGLIGLIVGAGIGGAATKNSRSTGQNAEPAPAVTVTQTIAAPTPMVTVTQTIKYAQPLPPNYATTVTFSGRTGKQTEVFEVPTAAARWRICYRFRGDGNSIIQLKVPGSDESALVLNEIGSVTDCSVRYEPSGRYYLDITGGPYTITIDIAG